MCTAAVYRSGGLYMGRTLDYEFSYGEEVVLTPRRFPLPFRHEPTRAEHYALLGTAHVAAGYPLYYDAVNEKGLGMAGLNFAESARYGEVTPGRRNVAQFEFIPWLLGQCATLAEARECLGEMELVGTSFSEALPASRLHWLIADESGALVVERTAEGLHVYDNDANVLTNEPPFPIQRFSLNDLRALSPRQPENHFSPTLSLPLYSRGMGALGLPGDLSSASRFRRAAFTALHALPCETESERVGQMFHILGSVEQTAGCCEVTPGAFERTIYTACWNAARGIYYYTTYTNRRITAVDMHRESLDSSALVRRPMRREEDIFFEP